MVKEARMIPQLYRRIAGLALRMVAVALSMATLALRIMIVEWPPRIAMINHANVNDADMRGLADVRCNCWPFVQTSLSVRSTAMTGNKVGASTCSARGKYKRYILATLLYLLYVLCLAHTDSLIHIVL
jgi:hypothetical protein